MKKQPVGAMKAGAIDYLFKGDIKRLVPAVTRELRDAQGRRNARVVEQQLKKRDAQLIDAQRLAHLGTWHADLHTGTAVWSTEVGQMLGLDPASSEQTIDQFIACLHEEDRAALDAMIRDQSVISIERDCRLANSADSEHYVHLKGEIVRDEDGAAIEAAGMIQDVTERHRAAMQVQLARDAAEQANRAKSEFLANMSHEIRTPMTAILGFTDLMLQPDQSQTDRMECVQTVRRNATHLLELINDILDISKIEAGKMTVERITCDIGQLLSDLVTLMKPRAHEKGLDLGISFQQPIPAQIQTDPLRLRQILVNLIGNAIKFTPAVSG